MNGSKTYREVCDEIAAAMTDQGHPTTGEEIWNASPSGELWHIPLLYRRFCRPHIPAPEHPVAGDLRSVAGGGYEVWNDGDWLPTDY